MMRSLPSRDRTRVCKFGSGLRFLNWWHSGWLDREIIEIIGCKNKAKK